MAKIRRAADLIRRRNRVPSLKETLALPRPGKNRTVGSAQGRHFGPELIRSILTGDIPTQDLSLPYRSDKDAKQQGERRQAQSAKFLEGIRKRLTGDRVGSPDISDEDFGHLGFLGELSEQIKQRNSFLARQRAAIRKKLEGQVGIVRRGLLHAFGGALAAAEKAKELASDIIGKLTGDTLKRKLAGFELLPKKKMATEQISTPGFRRQTPTQRQSMVGVSSSNVASVGWEPHSQQDRITHDSLGTLFIQFLNGWMYQYRDAPHWLYEALLRAPSKGKAVWALIRRGLYPDGIPYGSLSREGYERIR